MSLFQDGRWANLQIVWKARSRWICGKDKIIISSHNCDRLFSKNKAAELFRIQMHYVSADELTYT